MYRFEYFFVKKLEIINVSECNSQLMLTQFSNSLPTQELFTVIQNMEQFIPGKAVCFIFVLGGSCHILIHLCSSLQ